MFKSLAWPGPTALVLVLIAGIWAVTAGPVEFFAALQAGEPAGTRAMLILGGLATIASGVVACARPSIGTVTGLPGPDPGLGLPGRVVLVPADRGGLRAVQRPRERGGVAFFAHAGGFIFGLLAARLLARAGQTAPREQWRSTA